MKYSHRLSNTALTEKSCQELFNFELPSVQLERRCKKFMNKFSAWSSI